MSALPPSFGGVGATGAATGVCTDLLETKKLQHQQSQQEMPQKLSKSNPSDVSLSLAVDAIVHGPILGAPIYGQLVTLDQLSQHQRKQQQQQQHQGPIKASCASLLPQTPPNTAAATAPPPTTCCSAGVSTSAYANLDPSYSLKNKTTTTKQQSMDIETLDLAGSCTTPPSSSRTGAGGCSSSSTYSYPTFPYTTAASGLPQCPPVFRRPSHQGQSMLLRMSVKLIQTYENINKVYFRKKRRREQACEDNMLKRDRKGTGAVHPETTNQPSSTTAMSSTTVGHGGGAGSGGGVAVIPPAISSTSSVSSSSTNTTSSSTRACCQLHHVSSSNSMRVANVCTWAPSTQPTHLYDTGTRQQQQQQQPSTAAPPPTSCASSSSTLTALTRSIPTGVAVGAIGSSRLVHHQTNDFLKIGSVWLDRYEITGMKGKGTFGQVFRAHDRKTHEEVAIKVIKNRRQFLQQAEIEIKLLREIAHFQETDQRAAEVGANYVVSLKGYFTYQGHWCLVFELLSYNLYELLTYTYYRGVSLHLTLKFARQLCAALVFLSRPDLRVMHCDLKPENILLVTPKRSDIKVIDFGSSCHVNENVHQYIQSRFYRAPEVLLNLDYGLGIDMWSLGCILVEMHTGEPLFSGSNELEQFLQIVEVLGLPPLWMLERSPKLEHFFERIQESTQATGTSTSTPPERMDASSSSSSSQSSGSASPLSSAFAKTLFTVRGVVYRPRRIFTKGNSTSKCRFLGPHTRPLRKVVGRDTGGPAGRRLNEDGHAPEDYDKFIDLVQKMLIYDPRHRIKPDEALAHRFFERKSSSSSTAAAAFGASAPPSTEGGHQVPPSTLSSSSSSSSTTSIAVGGGAKPLQHRETHFPGEEVASPSVHVAAPAASPTYLTFAPNQSDIHSQQHL